jgi:CheY-like chemotaxis protein/biotin operon repressor
MGGEILETCKILVADDDVEVANRIKEILVSNGCGSVNSKSKINALREIEGYEIVILDIFWVGDAKPKYQSDNYFGIRAAEYLRQTSPDCKIILMSKYFYELDQLSEISKVCDDIFSSNGDSIKIFGKIHKVASTIGITKHDQPQDIILKEINLTEQILNEVDGSSKNQPDLIGMSNKDHATLYQKIKSLKEKYTISSNPNGVKEDVDIINITLNEKSVKTIKTAFLELLKEISKMSRIINTGGGTYNESINTAGGTYVQGDYINMSQNLTQAASDIEDLIDQLKKQGVTVDVAQEQVARDIATQAQDNSTIKNKLVKWGQSLGDATVSEVVKEIVKLAIRSAGIPIS